MTQEQTLEPIGVEALLDKVRTLQQQGRRLVQICATRLPDQIELTYSFDFHNQLASLRVHIPTPNATLPSISPIFGCAVLYENEIHDLFNVKFEGLTLDFKGNLYQTATKFPFATGKAPAAKPAPAPAAAKPATPAPTT